MTRVLAFLALVLQLSALTVPAVAQDDPRLEEARLAFERGVAAYDAGRLEEALEAFRHAHELTGEPDLLYNIATVADRLREDELAIRSYEAYLRERPGSESRASVEQRLALLRDAREEGTEAPPLPPPAPRVVGLSGAERLGERGLSRTIPDVAMSVALGMAFWADTVRFSGSSGTTSDTFDLGAVAFAPSITAHLRVGNFGAELDLPSSALGLDPRGERFAGLFPIDGHADYRIGNLSLAAMGVGELDAGSVRMTLRGGLGVALPTAYDRDPNYARCGIDVPCIVNDEFVPTLTSQYAFWAGLAMDGGFRSYRWGFDHWALFVPFGLEAWVGPLYLAADLLFSWLVHDELTDTVDLAVALEVGWEATEWLRISFRAQGYGIFDQPRDAMMMDRQRFFADDFMASIEPRVTIALGSFFGQLGVLVNLDEPFGVTGTPDDGAPGVWALRLSGGARF